MAGIWEEGPWLEKVIRVERVHRLASINPDGIKTYPRRWVVWAITDKNERVWVRTVEDDSEHLPLRSRSLIVKAYFEQLVGQEIEFEVYSGESYQECYSCSKDKLPENLLLDKFTSIYVWCEKNHPELLENKLEPLRKEKNQAVAATKKKNADELAERRSNALQLTFVEGRNPKWGDKQWQARYAGRLYVLQRGTKYDPSEGAIPVEEKFHLVPDKVILVRRI